MPKRSGFGGGEGAAVSKAFATTSSKDVVRVFGTFD
jgi:hypothetical protein